MSALLTTDQFTRVLPKKLKGQVNTALIDEINTTISDPILMEAYRDNLLSYTSVLNDGKFKIQDYLSAVRYVSCKLFGASNVEAYTKAFPDRYARFMLNQTSQKDIASYVSAYNKTKLVNLIMAQTLIPTHVLNADLYQKAINTQAELMIGASSEKVRTDAANSLLTHLKPPEAAKVELDITVKEDSAIADLRASTEALVQAQHAAISNGTQSAKSVAHSKLSIAPSEDDVIDAEVVEVIPEEEPEAVPVGDFSRA